MKQTNETKERLTKVLTEGKYVLSFDARNWIVSELSQTETNQEDISRLQGALYYPNIQQALIGMSQRMLKDTLSRACKDKVLSLLELMEICRENDAWMRKAIMGRCSIAPLNAPGLSQKDKSRIQKVLVVT